MPEYDDGNMQMLKNFQAPSSNNFRDILLKKNHSEFIFKMPKLSKGHNSRKYVDCFYLFIFFFFIYLFFY